MATDPTIGELFKQALVLDADVRAAVDAYMADSGAEVVDLGPNGTVNLIDCGRADARGSG